MTESTTVDSVIQQVIEEAKVVTGINCFPEAMTVQLKEDTENCIENHLH